MAFKLANGGSGQLVAVSTDCAGVDLRSCPGAVCKQVTAANLAIVVRERERRLRFPFPDTDAQCSRCSTTVGVPERTQRQRRRAR